MDTTKHNCEKRKLSEFFDESAAVSVDQLDRLIENHSNSTLNGEWMKLFSSSWFFILLQYLSLNDIAKLDSAFCNHENRIYWLLLLSSYSTNFNIECIDDVDPLLEWLVLKNVHFNDLKILPKYIDFDNREISYKTITKLINNCSHDLKKLEVQIYCEFYCRKDLAKFIFSRCDCYSNLEVLKLKNVEMTEYFQSLSIVCHRLKIIRLENLNFVGINQLLMVNSSIHEIFLTCYSNIMFSDTLEVLGQY